MILRPPGTTRSDPLCPYTRLFLSATAAIRNAIAAWQCTGQELLLFAAFWFLVGAVDDIGVDICWIWLKLTGQARVRKISREEAAMPLQGRAAVLIAAWREAEEIGRAHV